MKSNLKQEILHASNTKGAIVGFNVFGFEDAIAVIRAAEICNCPTLLMLNKLATKYLSIESWAGMLLPLIKCAAVPISLHLDHCQDFNTIVRAIHSGFSSVMIDGSQYSVDENIAMTREIVKIAHCFDVAVEGEIGSVPYGDIPGTKDITTSTEEAKRFVTESGVDWVAVAVGQIHRMYEPIMRIKFDRLHEIEQAIDTPLVIHGVSGIYKDDLQPLVAGKVAKLNFGTGIRVAFVETLKKSMAEQPNQYDKLILAEDAQMAVTQEAIKVMENLKM
ncbi:class II fructose-bisphosphate aldolase [Candidatus Epulonipiscium viviparus]|uniref:class II fructose-bisphosphate aldolase n=1 Tax=Candidatus Epulonipiscium viviparus TaxID=420336 RepID=UPI0027380D9F|nr:class II fructose-bisphosphate aldolase [Candidatus Epulopiscium viviparus]